MANEIAVRAVIRLKESGEKPVEIDTFTKYIDMTGTEYVDGIHTLSNTKENIDKGSIGTIGWIFMENLDSSITINAGDDADSPSIQMLAGEFFLGHWNATELSVIAASGTPRLRVFMAEL